MQLPAKFEVYLKTKRNISGKTLRNYRADLLAFTTWTTDRLANKDVSIQKFDDCIPYLTRELFETYKQHNVNAGVPQSTLNRRLSTLRNFGKFLVTDGILDENPTEAIENTKLVLSWEKQVESILSDFERNLTQQGVSRITLKNYLSDIRQFFAWSQRADQSF